MILIVLKGNKPEGVSKTEVWSKPKVSAEEESIKPSKKVMLRKKEYRCSKRGRYSICT